ncbi:heme/copper-type cytochrome/quinol oxidase subunit 4 [Brevibacillus aydinogluensis]|jgi:hypothetical protein|uniref:hypothetical protein n=1 Tax=Brevibacillus aydinogluensis TaxID=927786 RepID=UPI000E36AAFD|nr:hypothetical protein [Brevibacillus aydinogluensis]MDT3418244.1 heme/copper-type cytochrome/quinol oxidase subunit 4 [Brevibacillus aydinogluensis]REK61976.1 MAG: hypothetical protein DF221_14210 [Brevibacillus sp.]
MDKIMSKISAIYAIIWLTVLAIIIATQEEITLYYASIGTFVIGLIVLIGLFALKKILHIRSADNKKQEVLWGIIFALLFVALILFVVVMTALF